MTPATVLRQLARIATFRAPPRLLAYAIGDILNQWFGTSNRRYAFERLYLRNRDPWNYNRNTYELRKYDHALQMVLAHRRASSSALEIGCSVGVFSRMLARHFVHVTAVDVSAEAIEAAREGARGIENITFQRDDLRTMRGDGIFDVIVCAEILYYIPENDVGLVLAQLERHLAADGIVVTVSGISVADGGISTPDFDGWNDALARRFTQLFCEEVRAVKRPYRVAVFARA